MSLEGNLGRSRPRGRQEQQRGPARGINVIRYVPDQSVLKLEIGDRIRLGADDFERLSAAFFAEMKLRFLT
ncbi:hypothetical protein ACFFI2_42120 [Rhodococcus jostii]